MSNCPSYFPASCSSCSGSSSNDCNCGYVIERYDAGLHKWMTIRKNCEGDCVPPGNSTLAAAYAYNGMCRLRCCVPGSQTKIKYARIVLFTVVALALIALLYWIVRMIFFSETGQ